jgi:hypothetical protein
MYFNTEQTQTIPFHRCEGVQLHPENEARAPPRNQTTLTIATSAEHFRGSLPFGFEYKS